ncbi:MAG: hypothetical protein BAJATHORv1_10635 [Candidatus Thorarchaeota archaeon]|nr:MAG: hypothetical protein BAJATHORv1_10635 [Candidatus Thorarchaeota archaeon]
MPSRKKTSGNYALACVLLIVAIGAGYIGYQFYQASDLTMAVIPFGIALITFFGSIGVAAGKISSSSSSYSGKSRSSSSRSRSKKTPEFQER